MNVLDLIRCAAATLGAGLSANLFRGIGGALMLVLFDEIKAVVGSADDDDEQILPLTSPAKT